MSADSAGLAAALADRYRIERELGQGGMATVYLAEDLKHKRRVALKVLKPELAVVLGAERFIQEITTTAALQHPHILPLFDSGTADGFLYYVMPYVEGETLRDKLNRETQLSIEEAVRITTEVADALDYAHRHGVIHRDIKPENILLHDGRPMVADFGIALALSAAAGGRMTETGLSLGTPHYMSPEQATAEKDLTNRSDIYSLGTVLYEMLTGNPPHTGASAQQIIMKIVTEEAAPVTKARKSVPPNVAGAVARAIEKLPADRFASAAEFAHALKDPQFSWHVEQPREPGGGATIRPQGRDWKVWLAAAGLLVMAGLVGRWSVRATRAAPTVARFTIPLGDRSITNAPINALALSPDGQTIVYAGQTTATSGVALHTRQLDELDAHPVPGTEGATFPLFSPDGHHLSYQGPSGVFVLDVPLVGGRSTPVINGQLEALAPNLWLDNNTLLGTGSRGGIVKMTLDGKVTPVVEPNRAAGEQNLFLGAVLPDARTVLALPSTGIGIIGPVVAIDTRTGRRTKILDGPVNGVWYADGCLIWGEPSGTLRAARFDPVGLRITGNAVTVVESVQQEIGGGPQVAISPIGSLVYVPEQPLSLVLLDRSGKEQVLAEGHRFHSPRFSPDGRRLALDFTLQGSRSVWTFDLLQRTLSRLSFDDDGHDPVWTRDGRWVAYEHSGGIWRRHSDGSGSADSVYTGSGAEQVLEFAPDGSMLGAAFSTGSFDIVRLSADAKTVEPLMATSYSEEAPTVSRDGRWLAYQTDETGRMEVYVRPYPTGAKTLVSQGGGAEVRWAPDGRTLYYEGPVKGVWTMIAASVDAGTEFRVVKRTPLFAASNFEPSEPHANWDVSPDGTHFAMVHVAPLNTLALVLGWTEEVRRHSTGK